MGQLTHGKARAILAKYRLRRGPIFSSTLTFEALRNCSGDPDFHAGTIAVTPVRWSSAAKDAAKLKIEIRRLL